MRNVTWRRWLMIGLGLAAIPIFFLGREWKHRSDLKGQGPAEPFRIAGNLYYVGANDLTAFLLTGPEGDVLIGGGYPTTAPLIMASIAQLGFDIRDVKVLLNSNALDGSAGGLAELQKASGAQLWISEGDADVVAAGGAGGSFLGPFSFITYLPILRYPAPRVDHRFKDGDTIRVGPIELTAHITAGLTPGCTSWSFPIRDGDRELLVVHICGLEAPPALSLGEYPEIRADFERSFRELRSLPADIWVTSHAREFGRYRKFLARATAKDPADPFIDRDGYLSYIDSSEARFRKLLGGQ
jgi:metallo-beta-lactamase class B